MNSDLWNRASEVFSEAIELSSAERNEFVQQRCGDDVELLAEVESMLAEDEQATEANFLTPAIADVSKGRPQADTPEDSMIGQVIGPYRIDRLIGHGGMGNVYLAVRSADFASKVAIKLIRHGLNTQSIVSRFQNEIQVQAALGQHPNIAAIVDAGQTENGLPYFVMEYVDGKRIDEYCDSNRLSTAQRLSLFGAVCPTIQFAHQNAVIHRDLKPSNILVTADGRPVLIDFGIAKLLDSPDGHGEVELTQTEGRAFTPGYASPEQVSGKPLTTASDVYSLGVVLYEVLTGHKPYKLDRSSVSDMVDIVLKQNPPRPSEVVLRSDTVSDRSGDTKEISPVEICKSRDTSIRRLQQQLHGDLDQVVLKALHKDPARRYPTIQAFEADLQNIVSGHPVSARPDSIAYRTKKFIQRNKIPVAIATMLAVSLVAGTIGTVVGLVRANTEWQRAEANAKAAKEQEQIASRKARDAQKVVRDFYTNVSEDQLFDRPSLQPLRQEFLDEALAFYRSAYEENPDDRQVEHELGDMLVRVAIARESTGDI
ncbi:MAG: serine/threonine protein kinase, partial [Planctomycetales bacterium]|nr:serine/threonine protein kinase [Planctomycetales bacterium]